YDFDSELQWYLKRTKSKQRTNISGILHKILSSRVLMLSPFAPHIAEEIWEKLGNSELASKSAWPSSIGIEIDSKSIQTETLLKSIIEDINNILKVTKISPKKITIYTAEQWKSKAYNSILKNVLDGQTNIGTIIKSLITNKETEQIKKDPDFVKKTLNDILSEPVELRKGRMDIGQIDEKQIISSELSSLVKNDYDVELSVFSESDSEKYDPKNKAKAARPFKPAILIE
ncbi:MAG: class I tRNA ligase family protein, partial [Thaumarchaeota archaeon]|nr:class I tRNA ligase family protein [Nitrososphaerota archaeon]